MKTAVALSTLCCLTFSQNLLANELVIDENNYDDPIYDVGLAPKLKLADMLVLVANDENPNFTEEMKLELIAQNSNPHLSPFEVRKQKDQVLQKYQTVLEKAKSYVYADKIRIQNQLTGGFLFWDTYRNDYNKKQFEQDYDFDKEVLYFTNATPCYGNNRMSDRYPVSASDSICKKAYFKLPSETAEKLFYPKQPLNKLNPPLGYRYDVELINDKKITRCSLADSNLCIQTTFEKGTVKILDRATNKVLHQAEIELEK